MKLRKKTLIIISFTLISLIVILYAASQIILLRSFVALEEQDTHQNVERVQSALASEISNLDAFNYDWAAWDDTYDFIQDSNEDYIESNLLDETFIDSGLNLMIFVNYSGGIVFSKFFDLENEEEIPIPESLTGHLAAHSVLVQHDDTESSVAGMILLPEGATIVSSRPVLTSENRGPILGSLIMGYYFDSAAIESLAATTHLSVNMCRYTDSQMPSDFQAAVSSLSEESTIFTQPLNDDSIGGYALIEDIYGEPSLVLRVDMPRDIYKQGQTSIMYFLLSLFATGVVIGAVTMVLLEKNVLLRLAKLSTDVSRIRSRGDVSERVMMTDNDELSNLAKNINGMLCTLEQSHNKLRTMNKRTQLMNEKLGVVGKLTRHDVINKLSTVTGNTFLAKKEFTNNRKALKYFENIESACGHIERILDFARAYERLGVEELVDVNVEKSLEEAVSLFPDLHGVRVVNDCGGLTVLADSLLRQLFYNLIDNSLRHGEKVSRIRVYYKEDGKDRLKLVYEDDGIGIPQEGKEKIFGEGYGRGTGYGLYLIRKMCEVYGWNIQETGKQDKGAEFTITVPKTGEKERVLFKRQN
jgi:sensor domain CHASE-containing protein/two-component sensor histidine kinase